MSFERGRDSSVDTDEKDADQTMFYQQTGDHSTAAEHQAQHDSLQERTASPLMPSPSIENNHHLNMEKLNCEGTMNQREYLNWWRTYRSFVRKHNRTLLHWDVAITHLLYWAPISSRIPTSRASRWREMLYGLLSLHRMAMDMALQEKPPQNSYGTTLRVDDGGCIHAIAIRVVLTLTHCLLPTMLELSRCDCDPIRSELRSSRVRLFVERIKFLLRMTLMLSYWRKLRAAQQNILEGGEDEVVPGLFCRGGMCVPDQHSYASTTVGDECSHMRRRKYVGRRTGRRVSRAGVPRGTPTQRTAFHVMGEVLNVFRPLYWANVEAQDPRSEQPPWLSWVVALGIEWGALRCLEKAGSNASLSTREEMKRRRMKVFLCLLRPPAWEYLSHPVVRFLLSCIARFPLGGKLVESYLLESLNYWRHPYFLEES